MNHFLRLFAIFAMFSCMGNIFAQTEYEDMVKAEHWYADRCEGAISKFESMKSNPGCHPQKYTLIKKGDAAPLGYAFVVSTTDEREMIMLTPDGNDVKAKSFSKKDLPEEVYWQNLCRLGLSKTPAKDITLRERPLPVRNLSKAKNIFESVVDRSDNLGDMKAYNQMIFKPHKNAVRFAGQREKRKTNSEGEVILDEMSYTFKLNNPAVVAKMFRGYDDFECCPWVVKNSFFKNHNPLQYSRWKEGEPEVKAGSYVCNLISEYYGGRPIKDSRWVASVESAERSFYAVQFENQGTDALAALVCVAEGAVASVWEFEGKIDPEYGENQSIWFVDDEGNFMEHIPEIHCIVATDEGLELYVRMFGGESVQYIVLREMESVWMMIQIDYYIFAWE